MRGPQSVKIDRSDAHKLSLIGHANPRENMLNNGLSAWDALKIRSNPTLFRTRAFVAGRWHGSGATAVVDLAGDGKSPMSTTATLPR